MPITLSTAGSNGVFDSNGNSLTLAGPLSGPGGLQKVGAGTLTLAAANTYAGPTTLNAGMLVAASGMTLSATSTGTVTLNGGTLAAGAAGGTISGPVVAGSGPHTIAPGAALPFGYGTLNLFGGLTTNANTTLLFSTGGQVASDGSGSPIFGGDLINLGNSVLDASLGGSISFVSNPQTAGDYRLFAYGSTSPINLGNLSLPTQAGWTYTLSTALDPGYIDAVAALAASGGTWTTDGNGSWSLGSNWSCSPAVPSSGTVTFAGVPGNPSAPITVTLDGNQSAGGLVFNVSGSGYTLSQGTGGSLALGTAAGGSISVLGGTHTISAPVVLAGSLAVSTTGGGVLDLSGSVSEWTPGAGAIILNGGQLILSGSGSYTGGTTVNNGTLYLTNSTAIADGTSLTVGAGATFIFDPSVVAAPASGDSPAASPAAVAAVPEPGTLGPLERGWTLCRGSGPAAKEAVMMIGLRCSLHASSVAWWRDSPARSLETGSAQNNPHLQRTASVLCKFLTIL